MKEENDELFDSIRNGSEEEAREKYENLRETALRGAMVAIINRNNSHNLGQRAR
jgi:hypothetical protein